MHRVQCLQPLASISSRCVIASCIETEDTPMFPNRLGGVVWSIGLLRRIQGLQDIGDEFGVLLQVAQARQAEPRAYLVDI
jgi:hypothetical protein